MRRGEDDNDGVKKLESVEEGEVARGVFWALAAPLSDLATEAPDMDQRLHVRFS